MSPRVLIVTASVGEGHARPRPHACGAAPTRVPGGRDLRRRCADRDGRVVGALSESAPRIVFFRAEWLWDVGFAVFARIRWTRWLSQRVLYRLGSGGLLALVEERRPDVIVSMYPQSTEILGRLRASGRLNVPVCAAVTDLSALWYWATPGADIHLITHPESASEVRRIAGRTRMCTASMASRAPRF